MFETTDEEKSISDVFSQVTLPCGRTIQNRLVKVALYEHLSTFGGGPPNRHHFSLYSEWAKHNWGMIITGNVIVSNSHLTLGRDNILPAAGAGESSLIPFRTLAACIHGRDQKETSDWHSSGTDSHLSSTLAIMQLSHAGRQSCNVLGGRPPFQSPLAPSPIRVRPKEEGTLSALFHKLLFQVPREMTKVDIDEVVDSFVAGARVALESGFDGVQLHAAHGYLLSQFISPKSNTRSDEYSAEPSNALRLLHRIVMAIRTIVPKSFIVGIKLNASDYVVPNTEGTVNRALEHVLTIAQWRTVDFIEISGGDYEKPDFMLNSFSSRPASQRQAFFSDFSHQVKDALNSWKQSSPSSTPPLILLTGGLRTPGLLCTALAAGHADLLGIGRSSVLCPHLPKVLWDRLHDSDGTRWLDLPFEPEPDLELPAVLDHWPLKSLLALLPKINLIGAGLGMAWYIVTIRRLAKLGMENRTKKCGTKAVELHRPDYGLGAFGAVFWMWAWVCLPYTVRPFQTRSMAVVCLGIAAFLFVCFAN